MRVMDIYLKLCQIIDKTGKIVVYLFSFLIAIDGKA